MHDELLPLPEQLVALQRRGMVVEDPELARQALLRDVRQVSIHAAANRSIDLVERPTAPIVSQDGRVPYCARSQELKLRHGRPGTHIANSPLPRHSMAARQTAAEVADGARPVPTDDRWDAWCEGTGRGRVHQEALAPGASGKIVTVLTDNAWDVDGGDDEDHSGEDA